MFEVPALTPVTRPVVEPTVALPLLLVQVPPPISASKVVAPVQTFVVPLIEDGKGFTETVTEVELAEVPVGIQPTVHR